MTTFEETWPGWMAMVEQAFALARGERLAILNGRRSRTFDDRGLHPYSEVWGKIDAFTSEPIAAWLQEGGRELTAITPPQLRAIAYAAADDEFRAALLGQAKEG